MIDDMPQDWPDHDDEPYGYDEVPVGPTPIIDETPPEQPRASNPGVRTTRTEDPLAAAVRAADFAAASGSDPTTDDEPSVPSEGVTRAQADAKLLAVGWLKIVPNTPNDPADMYALTDPSLPTIDEADAWVERAHAAIAEHERNGGTPALRKKITERVERVELQSVRWLSMVEQMRGREPRYYPPHVDEARDLALRTANDDEEDQPRARRTRRTDDEPYVAYKFAANGD